MDGDNWMASKGLVPVVGVIICLLVVGVPLLAFYFGSPYKIQSIGLSMGLIVALALLPMLRKPEIQTKTTHLGDNLESLIKKIASASTEIRIVSGEAHPKIFDDPRMIGVLKAARERGVDIKMICGPTIAVENRSIDKSRKLFDLAQSEIVDLYISPSRQRTHFTIIDRNYVYKESYHEMLADKREATTIKNSFWESNRLDGVFNKEMGNSIQFKNAREGVDYILKTEKEIKDDFRKAA